MRQSQRCKPHVSLRSAVSQSTRSVCAASSVETQQHAVPASQACTLTTISHHCIGLSVTISIHNIENHLQQRQHNILLMASFPGQPGYARSRKAEQFWIFTKQEMMKRQLHQLDHMPIIYTSLQTAPHHSIFMGRMFFLTPNQQCQITEGIHL